MVKQFAVGDHVRWNSEAGYVEGIIIRKHTHDVEYKGYVHHATRNDPQYEIKSDKTDHIAIHKGTALTKILGQAGEQGRDVPSKPVFGVSRSRFSNLRRAIQQLGRGHGRPAIMCSEAVPWRCHRQLITDALIVAGTEVTDIISATTVKPAVLHKHARVQDGHLTYPRQA